jgi:hypothetical protein
VAPRLFGTARRLKWVGAVTSAVAWPALGVEILVWNDAATAVRENPHLARTGRKADQHLDRYATGVGLAAVLGPVSYLFARSLERRPGR